MRTRAIIRALVASVIVVASPSLALAEPDDQGDEAASTDETEQEADAVGPVAITIVGADEHHAAIRAAILAELKSTLDGASAKRLMVDISSDRVTVGFTDGDDKALVREIDRPADDADLVESIALISGNLARDQAGALLAKLEPEEEPPEDDESLEDDPAVEDPAVDDEESAKGESGEEGSAASKKRKRRKPRRRKKSKEPVTVGDVSPILTPAQAAFVSPLGVYPDSADRTFLFDFSALFGRSGGLSGLGIHGVGSMLHGDHHGLSVNGAWSYRGGDMNGVAITGALHLGSSSHVRGLEIAGAANLDVFGPQRSRISGVQIGGAVNASGDVNGAQIGGAVNVAGEVRGFQLGGATNVAAMMHGVQIGGAVNVNSGGNGFQLAGVHNHAGDFKGVQWSGVTNVADHVTGLQVGLVNVARKVDGLQLGLVNVSEENDGTAVGLLNFAGNGDVSMVTWASITSIANLGVKMRTGPFFVQPSTGYDPFDGDSVNWQIAIGGHVPIEPMFVEIVAGYLFDIPLEEREEVDTGESYLAIRDTEVDGPGHHQVRLLAQFGVQFVEDFGMFAGAGARLDASLTAVEGRPVVAPELLLGLKIF